MMMHVNTNKLTGMALILKKQNKNTHTTKIAGSSEEQFALPGSAVAVWHCVRVSTEIQQQCPVPPCQSIDVVHDGSLLVIVWFQVCDVLVCKVGV